MPDSNHKLSIPGPSLKGRLPFRLGTTSYIVAADLEGNVRALAPWVDDIELVLFDGPAGSNLPDAAAIARLADIAAANGLTYTVHFPNDADLGAPDHAHREASVAKCRRFVELTRPLAPHAWVAHFHGERRGAVPANDVPAWCGRLRQSMTELLDPGDMPPEHIAVETLDYPFDLILPIVEAFDLAICVDIGHLLVNGVPPLPVLRAHTTRCRVVHLHGVRNGEDHVDVAALPPELLRRLPAELAGTDRVVTLEIFGDEYFRRCYAALQTAWAEATAR